MKVDGFICDGCMFWECTLRYDEVRQRLNKEDRAVLLSRSLQPCLASFLYRSWLSACLEQP